MGISEDEYKSILSRPGVRGESEVVDGDRTSPGAAQVAKWAAERKAKRKKRPPPAKKHRGVMTKTEAEYAEKFLRPALLEGLAVRVDYERVKFVLGDNCVYTPDFYVVWQDRIQVVEVKGGHAEKLGPNTRDGRTRWKVAAEQHPEFEWLYAQRLGDGSWKIEEYGA